MDSIATAPKVVRWAYANPELPLVALGSTPNAGWVPAMRIPIHVNWPIAHKEHPATMELPALKTTNAPRVNAKESPWIVRHLMVRVHSEFAMNSPEDASAPH